MKKQTQKIAQEYEEVLREDFLDPNELFLLNYLAKFNRAIARKWQEQGLGNFSTY